MNFWAIKPNKSNPPKISWHEDRGLDYQKQVAAEKGESEITSVPRKGGDPPMIANPIGKSNITMQPMHDKENAIMVEGMENTSLKL